ncbi:hypothetical protein [Vibrio parahaemolyticus]|uniref:hypothetical protein n=2 Tax=Vibrio parahaemolyticus TaxID=670 RepID=UPI00069CDCD4|nr:hypothetical protein [Vibrio parahaemolyticus]AKU54720.1 hypothetical protein FORC8_1160 [Vibrio parahaemolyticus]EJI1394731.1 hypothetical protein [Vibrio parahaemolyticus]MCR9859561.1 hypothetical protein [Vibrio parahaemolyticus]TOM93851.1 hypothetical protein CGH66_23990 [Vibrio parahaemolyticus]TOM97212.1 hypothetical protein CGH67_26025 [Vibrio parahaemolyticus]
MKNKIVDLFASNSESVIDLVLSDGLLKDIPIIGNIVSVLRIGQDVSNHLFAQKLGAFLEHLRTHAQRESLEALKDQSKLEALGTNMILVIDKSNSVDKPKWLAQAFIGLSDGMIDIDLFDRLVYSIDSFSPALKGALLKYYHPPHAAIIQSEHFKRNPEHAEELSNQGLLRREFQLNSINNSYSVKYAKTSLGAALAEVIRKSA